MERCCFSRTRIYFIWRFNWLYCIYFDDYAAVGGLGDLIGQLAKTAGATGLIELDSFLVEDTSGTNIEHVKGNIKFDKVSFAYPSRPESNIINDFSFTLKAGEKLALIGKSGAGKSTS